MRSMLVSDLHMDSGFEMRRSKPAFLNPKRDLVSYLLPMQVCALLPTPESLNLKSYTDSMFDLRFLPNRRRRRDHHGHVQSHFHDTAHDLLMVECCHLAWNAFRFYNSNKVWRDVQLLK